MPPGPTDVRYSRDDAARGATARVKKLSRKYLDDVFPTVVRYAGVLIAITIVVAGVLGKGGTTMTSGGVLALGMILYKTVKGAANGSS